MTQEDVVKIIEFLNGDDCLLFEGNDAEHLKINRADLNHLFHQEGSTERLLAHLTTMGQRGQRFKNFHDLVPAINRQFTGAVVLSAVIKFKALLTRARKRRGEMPVRRSTRSDSIFSRLKKKGYVNEEGKRVVGAWIDDTSDASDDDSDAVMDVNEEAELKFENDGAVDIDNDVAFRDHQPPQLDMLLVEAPTDEGDLHHYRPTPTAGEDSDGFTRHARTGGKMSVGTPLKGSLAALSRSRRSATPQSRMSSSRHRRNTSSGSQAYTTPTHTCKRCGVKCRKMRNSDVEKLVAYLNSPECNLFSTEVAEDLRISKKDLYHLWHQEASIERTLQHLRALSLSDQVFSSFHELVPAVHKFFTTAVVMSAVIKWKHLWKRGKARRSEIGGLSRHSFVGTPGGGRRKRASSIFSRMKNRGFITGKGVEKLGAYIEEEEGIPVVEDGMYYCKLCGAQMERVPDEAIGHIITYLNSEECEIFSESNPDALMIKRKDLDHLFHQLGSVDMTIERLKGIDAQGTKCAHFADVVPAMTSFNAAGTVVRAALRFRRNLKKNQDSKILCGVCDFPMANLSKLETTAMVDYLNSQECNLFMGSQDDELLILKKDLQHLFHQEGDIKRTLENLTRMSDAGLRFNNFDEVVPATFRYLTAGVCMNAVMKFKFLLARSQKRRGVKPTVESTGRSMSIFSTASGLGYVNDGKRMRIAPKMRPSIVTRRNSFRPSMLTPPKQLKQFKERKTTSPVPTTPAKPQYKCKRCGFEMEKLTSEQVQGIIEFLNSEECVLFTTSDGQDLKITLKDVDHLFHQEGSLERTLDHFKEINKRGISYSSFSELVPAIHKMFLSTHTVLNAVFKFKYLLNRLRRRHAQEEGGEGLLKFYQRQRTTSLNQRLLKQGFVSPLAKNRTINEDKNSPSPSPSPSPIINTAPSINAFRRVISTEPSMMSLAEESDDDDESSIM
jgi:hypothetical protein